MAEEYDTEKIERERQEAFVSRDSKKYYDLCNELGIDPEDSELYELGSINQPDYTEQKSPSNTTSKLHQTDAKQDQKRKHTESELVQQIINDLSRIPKNIKANLEILLRTEKISSNATQTKYVSKAEVKLLIPYEGETHSVDSDEDSEEVNESKLRSYKSSTEQLIDTKQFNSVTIRTL